LVDHDTCGPTFGRWALRILDQCQCSDKNFSYLDNGYVNHTGIPAREVLTGSQYFTVKEIEVFEVI
jgi:hypothetical protein